MATKIEPLDAEQPPAVEDAPAGAATRSDASWRQWMMVGLGLIGLLSILAVIVSVATLADSSHTSIVQGPASMSAMMGSPSRPAPLAAASGKPEAVTLAIKSDTEHAKLAPDGKYHDAFLPANFTVHAGDRVTVTVSNYDNNPHSFTSSSLSTSQLINQNIPAGSASAPSTTTFTFTAPSTTGKYQWWCALPCDPYSMSHIGYMRGYVSVVS